jgi:hypothetical protein
MTAEADLGYKKVLGTVSETAILKGGCWGLAAVLPEEP